MLPKICCVQLIFYLDYSASFCRCCLLTWAAENLGYCAASPQVNFTTKIINGEYLEIKSKAKMEALPAISEVLCEGWMVKSPPVPPVETKIIPGYSLFKAVRH